MIWKLVMLVALVAAVWFGFRYAERLGAVRQAALRRGGGGAGKASGGAPAEAENMIECPVCGVYAAPDQAANCGRGDCPY